MCYSARVSRLALSPGVLADRLVLLLIAAAILGAALPDAATLLGERTILWLAILVFSVGLTLRPADFVSALHRPLMVPAAVLMPLAVLAIPAIVLARLYGGPASTGVLAIASAPAEVSAVLLTTIAAGDAAMAACVVSISLLLSPLTILLAFELARVPTAISPMDLLLELGFGVAAPLVIALSVGGIRRSRAGRLAIPYAPDVGSAALCLLLFSSGAAARTALGEATLSVVDWAVAVAGIAIALGVPFAAGSGLARAMRLPPRAATAMQFSCGMREFGVATAVAQIVAPASAVVPALYGILLMTAATLLARRISATMTE